MEFIVITVIGILTVLAYPVLHKQLLAAVGKVAAQQQTRTVLVVELTLHLLVEQVSPQAEADVLVTTALVQNNAHLKAAHLELKVLDHLAGTVQPVHLCVVPPLVAQVDLHLPQSPVQQRL